MELTKAQEALRREFLRLREEYEKAERGKVNILVTGDYGTGKTSLAADAPKPVHIDSFDPGGTRTKVLKPLIKSGDIIVDRAYEIDSWKDPKAYALWYNNLRRRVRENYFDGIGTYFLDSATRWALSQMFQILKEGGRMGGKTVVSGVGSVPQQQDYLFQQLAGGGVMSEVMNLPCHVVVTGHITRTKNEVTGGFETSLMVWGKYADQLPTLFDEKYLMRIVGVGESAEHVLQVKSDGIYKAETRMGGSSFKMFEPPNLRELLKRAGKPYEDKPRIGG